MSEVLGNLLSIVNPDDVVGYREDIERFQQQIAMFARSNPNKQGFIITGPFGSGRTTLLSKFHAIADAEGLYAFRMNPPMNPKDYDDYLYHMKLSIEELVPGWQGFFGRVTRKQMTPVTPPPEAFMQDITLEEIQKRVNEFFLDLEKINEKLITKNVKILFVIDDLQRFKHLGYESLIQIIFSLMQELMKKRYNFAFLVTIDSETFQLYDGLYPFAEFAEVFETKQLDFNEADLLLRRRTDLSSDDRALIVKESTRLPYDLYLRVSMMKAGINYRVLSPGTLSELFGLDEASKRFMYEFGKYPYNNVPSTAAYRLISKSVLESLIERDLIVDTGGIIQFRSYGLWDVFRSVFRPLDPYSELVIYTTELDELSKYGLMPSSRVITNLEGLLLQELNNTIILEASSRIAEAAERYVQAGYPMVALDLTTIATRGFLYHNDYEKAGDFSESMAKIFSKNDEDYLAAITFYEAGNAFANTEIQWRMQSNYRDAGARFRRVASELDPKQDHYTIRGFLARAMESYALANETGKIKRILRDAEDLLQAYPIHLKYLKKLASELKRGDGNE